MTRAPTSALPLRVISGTKSPSVAQHALPRNPVLRLVYPDVQGKTQPVTGVHGSYDGFLLSFTANEPTLYFGIPSHLSGNRNFSLHEGRAA